MDKYRRVIKDKKVDERPAILPNEVRIIASQRTARNYITYALNLLTATDEKAQRSIVLRAMGRAINKTINICEIIKRRVAGLHQVTKLESVSLVDNFEPMVQGLEPKEITRTVSSISITLSKDPLTTSDPGYQSPLPESEVRTEEEARESRQKAAASGEAPRRGRRGGRGGRRGGFRGGRRGERGDRGDRGDRGNRGDAPAAETRDEEGERGGYRGGRRGGNRPRRGGAYAEAPAPAPRGGRGGRGGRRGEGAPARGGRRGGRGERGESGERGGGRRPRRGGRGAQ